jgi:hypothetical protein
MAKKRRQEAEPEPAEAEKVDIETEEEDHSGGQGDIDEEGQDDDLSSEEDDDDGGEDDQDDDDDDIDDDDGDDDAAPSSGRPSAPPPAKQPLLPSAIKSSIASSDGRYHNRQRLLVLSSRGITARYRHLLEDLRTLIPHSKKESKLDVGEIFRSVFDAARESSGANDEKWHVIPEGGPSSRAFVVGTEARRSRGAY